MLLQEEHMTRARKFRSGGLAALIALIAGGALAGGGGSGAQLALVAYSTPKTAYDALIPAFQQTPAGKGVTFTESFGASGAQSRAVASGQQADVVAFSTTPDVTRLVKAGVVAKSWDANPNKGSVTDWV